MCNILEVAYCKIEGQAVLRPYIDITVVTMYGESAPFKALIDTGACITWVPEEVLNPLKPDRKEPLPISSPLLKVRKIKPYTVSIAIQNCGEFWSAVTPYRGVLATNADYAYLGRDVINNFIVTLDGETVRLEKKKGA